MQKKGYVSCYTLAYREEREKGRGFFGALFLEKGEK